MTNNHLTDPPKNCGICPRLSAFRNEWQKKEPNWFNAPVPTFGDQQGKLLILGLAPGLRGANATGRPFTGDYAGDLLYDTLIKFDLASGQYQKHIDDGLKLHNCMISNAVRCVPPENKPVALEINNCRPFLQNTLRQAQNINGVLVLGKIAHDSFLRTLGLRLADYPFKHEAMYTLPIWEGRQFTLFDSYHCSRYNTNTRRLTTEMFENVFEKIRQFLNSG